MPNVSIVRNSMFAASLFALQLAFSTTQAADKTQSPGDRQRANVDFSLRSVASGNWSDPKTWQPARVPGNGDRVLVGRDTHIVYDVASDAVIRLIQVAGTLSFARNRDTLLNVGILKVQSSESCSESGFACDLLSVNDAGEPHAAPEGPTGLLEIGTAENPIPAEHTARVRLHFLEGMNKDDGPAVACCSARMELHGTPLARTWVKLGNDAKSADTTVALSEACGDWRVGDEIIITASKRGPHRGTFRNKPETVRTEERRITKVDGPTIHLDKPLDYEHYGTGEFRSEVANLSRNVVIESADPDGVRGHTMFHRFSGGSISYVRFAHLGKEGVLGRYSIHYHLVGDTMRGSSLVGAAIVDSHNRWVTIHGTQYLVVRDCVGYQSVGHGFFLEDATEVANLLDGNLGVQAYRGKRLPKQVLPFDPNDGAAFWWSNGRNTLVHNVACENDEYGFRYDCQKSSAFDARLPILTPSGTEAVVDVRTIPIWRFDGNEAHSEGLYGMVVAANGNQQPDTTITTPEMLAQLRRVDWTGPDTQHPHTIRNLSLWETHYAFRPHSPAMLLENVRIHRAAYGIYRPAFENQVYRNLSISQVGAEPFNRGMDDASAQTGSITVDGLTFDGFGRDERHPLIQISDNNLSGTASSHFRNVSVSSTHPDRALVNRGGTARANPIVDVGVPVYLHDYFGPGRHARVVSTLAADLLKDGHEYRKVRGLTGDESVVTEVTDVEFPTLLDPVDDLPPATVITSIRRAGDKLTVKGISHDNGDITRITVNGKPAEVTASRAGVVDWEATLDAAGADSVTAFATDNSGNTEQTPHKIPLLRTQLSQND